MKHGQKQDSTWSSWEPGEKLQVKHEQNWSKRSWEPVKHHAKRSWEPYQETPDSAWKLSKWIECSSSSWGPTNVSNEKKSPELMVKEETPESACEPSKHESEPQQQDPDRSGTDEYAQLQSGLKYKLKV